MCIHEITMRALEVKILRDPSKKVVTLFIVVGGVWGAKRHILNLFRQVKWGIINILTLTYSPQMIQIFVCS